MYFTLPTPTNLNLGSVCYTGYNEDPIFDLAAGYYPNTQLLTISLAPSASGIIYYSEDGDNPDVSEIFITGPISISSTKIIRARLFSSSGTLLPSKIITKTYLINQNLIFPFSV